MPLTVSEHEFSVFDVGQLMSTIFTLYSELYPNCWDAPVFKANNQLLLDPI